MTVSKKIVIDARVVVRNQGHGIARHTDELISHIKNHNLDYEIVVLVNRSSPYLHQKFPVNFRFFVMRSGWISAFSQLELPFVLRKLKPDLFHSPSFMVPIFSQVSLVATIHDLNHVVLSENYSILHRLYYNLFLPIQLKRAQKIITVSHFSKQQIISFFQVKEDKVHVIYNGIHETFRPLENRSSEVIKNFKMRYELPDEYILSIGNKKPHKNVARLVEAYCLGNFPIPLVLLSDFDTKLLDIAQKFNKKHLIYFLRYIRDEDFSLLYGLAKVFAYPSIYEGFGLPPLEAAACGTPVVVSDRSSLPEIMRDAAIYVDPLDPEKIRAGLEKALENSPATKTLIEKGIEVSKLYSWDRMAEETVALYKKLLS